MDKQKDTKPAPNTGVGVDAIVRPPRVYKMNDYDWWADYSEDEANKNYRIWQIEQVGLEPEDCEDDEAIELTETEMDTLNFVGDNSALLTFREALQEMIEKGEEFPCVFASTD